MKTTLNTRLDEVFTRITNLEGRLAPLEDLPLLSTHLSAAEEVITRVKTEQANLRRQYDELCAANSAAAPDVSSVRRIDKLENCYPQLNAAQQNLSNELVITGLPTTDTTSLKGAVYAALKLLDVELLESDIHHVRKMRQKPSLEPLNHTTSITAEELQNINEYKELHNINLISIHQDRYSTLDCTSHCYARTGYDLLVYREARDLAHRSIGPIQRISGVILSI